MSGHLRIDYTVCIGCGRCVSVCIRDNITIVNGVAKESPSSDLGCFDCGHCLAICPKDAIRLERYADEEERITEYRGDRPVIEYGELMDLLRRRRSCRWFTDEPVTEDEFKKLFDAAYYSPTAQNSQTVRFAVIQSRLDEFMTLLAEILEPLSKEYPRIMQFCDHVKNPSDHEYDPFLWEGKQIIIAFSREPADAYIAMSCVELAAYTLGLGGFYSLWISKADAADHNKLMSFFPDIPSDMKMNTVFVIGRPRTKFKRTVPRDKGVIHLY